MFRLTALLPTTVALGLSLGACLPARSQCGNLYVPCEAGSLRVQFDVPSSDERPEVIGYHLYRKTLGDCDSLVHLTGSPWVRTPASAARYDYIDTVVEPGVKYNYWTVGVTAGGAEVSLQDCYYNPPFVYASCGLAPLTHGTIDAGGWITPCTPCWESPARLFTFPAAMAQYFGTGTALLLYGDAGCTGDKGCLMDVQSFQVAPCTIAVEGATWGVVKQRFR